MGRASYVMRRVRLADCRPHADAEAYSCSTGDRAALANSVAEAGVFSPIAVVPDEDGGGYYVIDGIGRMNALAEAGETETVAQVFDLGPMPVAEFVAAKNSMMRKVTTGARVMAYLKCHEREVLAAADPERYSLRGRDAKGRIAKPAVSHETAGGKGWGAKEIAGRIGVSKNDVLAGIELLKECCQCGNVANANSQSGAGYEQGVLSEVMDAVLRGETPIRRWKAAACGMASGTGGRAAADYAGIGARTMASLAGLWRNWQTVPMDCRGAILRKFHQALEVAPEDFRPMIVEWARNRAGLDGKGRRLKG